MPPELIIFDCDGVLIDSEGVAAAITARELTRLGWPMDAAEGLSLFLGMSIHDMQPIIEARLGRSLPHAWRAELADQYRDALAAQARIIPGARDMLERVNALGIPWRVASNSSQEEMDVKFARTGLTDLTAGLTHPAASVIALGGRPKPAPDIFLAAAAAAGVPPADCLVLEDSPLGITGAVAAGMRTYGFDPHGDGTALRAAGAIAVLRRLDELFGVLE
jgi:HAD superfamily hydrolase (TIGR01509 family)